METIGDSPEEFRGFEAKNHPLRCGNSLRKHRYLVGGVGRLGIGMITTESLVVNLVTFRIKHGHSWRLNLHSQTCTEDHRSVWATWIDEFPMTLL